MGQPAFVGSSITTRGGDAEVHGRMRPVAPTGPAELLLGAGQADLETFGLAEPAFRLGFGDSGDQVVADLGKPCPLGRVRSQERASDASIRCPVLQMDPFQRPRLLEIIQNLRERIREARAQRLARRGRRTSSQL